MKYNLKNRPDPTTDAVTWEQYQYYQEMEEWFEGFEKELREKMKRFNVAPMAYDEEIDLIKEILGE